MKKFLLGNRLAPIGIIVMYLILVNTSFGQGSVTFSTPGTFSNGFTVPTGVTSITVRTWGGGGGGGADATNNNGGPGGGGGAYSSSVLTVTPGNQFTVVVGAGGAANLAGGQSSFGASVIALGGGSSTTSTAGVGGQASGGTGQTKFSGGNGGIGSGATTTVGGSGGGSSASSGGNGVNGSNFSGTTGGAGGNGPDGDGGKGGDNGVTTGTNAAQPGTAPGGGGGGRGDNGGTSGAGATGRVIITWTCPSATISYPSTTSLFCKSNTSITPTINGTSGGTFSATPAGLSIITATGVINPSTSTAASYTVHYQIASGGNGCTAVDATSAISIFELPTTSFTKNDVQCFNTNTGQITVTGNGGISPYTYSIDNGANYSSPVPTGSFNNLSAGTYKIRVKDSKGCESRSVQ